MLYFREYIDCLMPLHRLQCSQNIFEKFSKLLCSFLVYLHEVIGINKSAQEILGVTVCLVVKGPKLMWFWMGPMYSWVLCCLLQILSHSILKHNLYTYLLPCSLHYICIYSCILPCLLFLKPLQKCGSRVVLCLLLRFHNGKRRAHFGLEKEPIRFGTKQAQNRKRLR